MSNERENALITATWRLLEEIGTDFTFMEFQRVMGEIMGHVEKHCGPAAAPEWFLYVAYRAQRAYFMDQRRQGEEVL